MWLCVEAFNRIHCPRSTMWMEGAVICGATAANMMLVQQKRTSLVCRAAKANWVQPTVPESVLLFNFRHRMRGNLECRAGTLKHYWLGFSPGNGKSEALRMRLDSWKMALWAFGRWLRCPQHRSYFSASFKLPLKWKLDFTLAKLRRGNRFGSILNQRMWQK